MQVTVTEPTKVLKSGTNDYGPWKLVKVVTDKEEYTTLAKGADELGAGAVINIEGLDQNEKEQWKFKKFEIVSVGEPPQPKPVEHASKEEESKYWEKKQALERLSIEGQKAMEYATALELADKSTMQITALLHQTIELKLRNFVNTYTPESASNAPESSKKPPKASTSTKAQDTDMDIIKGALTTLKWNPIEWFKETFEIEVETVTDFMLKANKLQRDKFKREINERLEALENEIEPEDMPF